MSRRSGLEPLEIVLDAYSRWPGLLSPRHTLQPSSCSLRTFRPDRQTHTHTDDHVNESDIVSMDGWMDGPAGEWAGGGAGGGDRTAVSARV